MYGTEEIGVPGSTSSSVFIVEPGGLLGSRLPARNMGQNANNITPTNILTNTFAFVVFIFMILTSNI